jgi:hypothetical protein
LEHEPHPAIRPLGHQQSEDIPSSHQQTPDNSVTMMDSIPSEIPPDNLAALAEDHYFGSNPPPKDLEKHVALAQEFIDYHSAAGRRLVLVTSGGTTVPLGMLDLGVTVPKRNTTDA